MKPSFYKKIFLTSEIEYCLRHRNPYEHFAGKFAIKEAVKKSIKKDVSMLDIKTSHSNSRPTIEILNKKIGKFVFVVSLSHDKQIAIAVVISERIHESGRR